jgi:deoxyribose-phosphate aldolase
LKTDDTPASVLKLVKKVNAFQESRPDWPLPASVCVYPNFAATVKDGRACDFNITVVSACFPTSQSFLEVKLKECEMAVEQGADEVDIVLALNSFLAGDYEMASEEIRQVRKCIDEVAARQNRNVHLKVILETGLLRTPEAIANASFLAMEAGADFIKTSTGKVDVNATPVAAYVMCECIARYHAATGRKVGFKPAGGISSAADALCYYSIVSSILGKEWLNKSLFRFGVSRVANSILSAVEQKTVSYF